MKKKRNNYVNDKKYHYTYRITNVVENKYYYGVHSCNCLPKEDIGVKYFSTSKNKAFKQDMKDNPQDYKYKVIKIFGTRVEAVEHEIFLHAKFNVGVNKKFYNGAKQTSTRFDTSGTVGRSGYTAARDTLSNTIVYISTQEFYSNDIYEAIFKNKKHTEKTKELIKLAKTGIASAKAGMSFEELYDYEKAKELKQNLSICASKRIGELNPFYGKHHTKETKEKIAEASIGMAVYVSETGENIRISVEEANIRGLSAESKGRKYSNEINKKKWRPGYGKKHTEEAKEKIKNSWHESRPKTKCPHCEKLILKQHNRFHFDNCKLKGMEL